MFSAISNVFVSDISRAFAAEFRRREVRPQGERSAELPGERGGLLRLAAQAREELVMATNGKIVTATELDPLDSRAA
jgi:hypothetical protein